jgi:hypothetical protein
MPSPKSRREASAIFSGVIANRLLSICRCPYPVLAAANRQRFHMAKTSTPFVSSLLYLSGAGPTIPEVFLLRTPLPRSPANCALSPVSRCCPLHCAKWKFENRILIAITIPAPQPALPPVGVYTGINTITVRKFDVWHITCSVNYEIVWFWSLQGCVGSFSAKNRMQQTVPMRSPQLHALFRW